MPVSHEDYKDDEDNENDDNKDKDEYQVIMMKFIKIYLVIKVNLLTVIGNSCNV